MKRNILKNIIIITVILFILFLALVILNITMGFMKIEEFFEYAQQVENSNFTYVLAPLMFTGAIYTIFGSIIIFVITIFFKRIDIKIKMTLHMLPFFTVILAIPALLVASEIVDYYNLFP